jgi:molecular chaperone DnaK
MMRLGVDFGTTRIVVAAVDRGNYPVVSFEDADQSSHDWFPPLIAARGGERLYGWDAWAAQDDLSYTIVRSIKRVLEDAGPGTLVEIGEVRLPIVDLLTEVARALKTALLTSSNLPGKRTEILEVMLGVPANANSNQRFLTVEPFQRAGFSVLGLLNEPSAASIEYGHKSRGLQPGERVLVYDLGGGTFDVSLVEIEDHTHTVIRSEGVPTLGGDDFDVALADLALETAGLSTAEQDALTQAETFRLHDECRIKKEGLHPNTRRITIDLRRVRPEWEEVSISADGFYAQCRPLLEQTIAAAQALAGSQDMTRVESVYVTGGGSELPLVSRMLKEAFGRRVKRSAHTECATAIGLAIQADQQAGYVLRESFTRHFGVWREAEAGEKMIFDPLFAKGTELPAAGARPLTLTRIYSPVHSVGHFRYVECSHKDAQGQPTGEITVWDEIYFPFDPELQLREDLSTVDVRHADAARTQEIEERYTCDSNGTITAEITNVTAGYSRGFHLGKWAGKQTAVVPGKRSKQNKPAK